MRILNDPTLLFDNERIAKKIEAVKKDKKGLVNAASDYNSKYKQEIDEGTRKQQLLIEDGLRRGLKEEDALRGQFLPSRHTPILNFLYFMLREENLDVEFEKVRNDYNKQYGHLEDTYMVEESDNVEDVPEMDTFIYGEMDHNSYKKIKKLKRLALDHANANESLLAYQLCLELCKRYNLEYDKVVV